MNIKVRRNALALVATAALLTPSGTAFALDFGTGAPAGEAASDELGGWSEDLGDLGDAQIASQVRHTGRSERTTISGTTHKRSHGWTTWVGVRHYTRARLVCGSRVIADSGRRYGTSGTEAISPWTPFNPNKSCDGYGRAKSNYGR